MLRPRSGDQWILFQGAVIVFLSSLAIGVVSSTVLAKRIN
jgi:hypothetical protein